MPVDKKSEYYFKLTKLRCDLYVIHLPKKYLTSGRTLGTESTRMCG